MAKKLRPLTEKMAAFADEYRGDGVEAARAAGYGGSPRVLGVTAARLMTDPRVRSRIEARRHEAIERGRSESDAEIDNVEGVDGEDLDQERMLRDMLFDPAIRPSDKVAASRELRQITEARRKHAMAESGGDVFERLRAKIGEQFDVLREHRPDLAEAAE